MGQVSCGCTNRNDAYRLMNRSDTARREHRYSRGACTQFNRQWRGCSRLRRSRTMMV